jgi:hypothetical protein
VQSDPPAPLYEPAHHDERSAEAPNRTDHHDRERRSVGGMSVHPATLTRRSSLAIQQSAFINS